MRDATLSVGEKDTDLFAIISGHANAELQI